MRVYTAFPLQKRTGIAPELPNDVYVPSHELTDGDIEQLRMLRDEHNIEAPVTMCFKLLDVGRHSSALFSRREYPLTLINDNQRACWTFMPVLSFVELNPGTTQFRNPRVERGALEAGRFRLQRSEPHFFDQAERV
jgi:hypothetical protein